MKGAAIIARINEIVPANTAIRAATAKGLAPNFAMLLNLTFEPTPTKEIAKRKGSIFPPNVDLNKVHVSKPDVGRYESRIADIIELMIKITPNKGTAIFVLSLSSFCSNLLNK